MTFGQRIRELRQQHGMTLRILAERVGVGFTYLSKIENSKLEDGHSPSDSLIHRLAEELNTDEEELQLLAERVPDSIRARVLARPEAFRLLANLRDSELDKVVRRVKHPNG